MSQRPFQTVHELLQNFITLILFVSLVYNSCKSLRSAHIV